MQRSLKIACVVPVFLLGLSAEYAPATPPSIDQQPADQRATLNLSAVFSITASGSPPLSYQWFKNGAALTLATNGQLLLGHVQFSDEALYSVTASNAEGTATSTNASLVVALPRAGDLDGTFVSSPNGAILSVAVADDQTVLIAGAFSAVDALSRPSLAWLGPNGSLTDFSPFIFGGNAVLQYAAFAPGGILIAGKFSYPSDQGMRVIGRLFSDGSPDYDFGSGLSGSSSDEVLTASSQTNGVTLAATYYTDINGSPFYGGITWLDAAGSPIASMPFGTNTITRSIALQGDGKALIGGYFTNSTNVGLVRLNADRSVDTSFHCVVSWGGEPGDVYSVLLQPDGKVLIGGLFDSVNGQTCYSVARLNSDGSLDSGFQSAIAAVIEVYCLALQPDGKILLGGTGPKLARLNSDGSWDASFAGPSSRDLLPVRSIALQKDNKIIIGGLFTNLNGVTAPHIARCWGTDYPPVLKSPALSTSGVDVAWHAISNRTYRVQYTEDFSLGTWADLSGDVLATGDVASKHDSSSAGSSQRFYRVLALP